MDSCPYCSKAIFFEEEDAFVYKYKNHERPADSDITGFDIAVGFCPSCGRLIVLFRQGIYEEHEYGAQLEKVITEEIIYPKYSARNLPDEVPEPYKSDFQEAAAVLSYSPKASAAISRRLLQNLLREQFKIKHSSLAKEIDEFLKLPGIPSYLTQAVDAIRNIGNFAAHPLKDTSTGEIVDVEDGEAEWLLDVLDSLFDYVFVQPKLLEKRRKHLNEKLKKLGKPPMKTT